MNEKLTFTDYREVDKEQLHSDLEAIKKNILQATEQDFQHLLKLEL